MMKDQKGNGRSIYTSSLLREFWVELTKTEDYKDPKKERIVKR